MEPSERKRRSAASIKLSRYLIQLAEDELLRPEYQQVISIQGIKRVKQRIPIN
jgi:hypothetical protein